MKEKNKEYFNDFLGYCSIAVIFAAILLTWDQRLNLIQGLGVGLTGLLMMTYATISEIKRSGDGENFKQMITDAYLDGVENLEKGETN